MKRGRGRAYPAVSGLDAELAMLAELRARVVDLVADLPPEALRSELHGHSISQLRDHMIWAECHWIGQLPGVSPPLNPDCQSLDGFTRNALAELSLDSAINVGPFITLGQLLRHLQWHWTYHSAQIGLLRRALGHRYEWTFAGSAEMA